MRDFPEDGVFVRVFFFCSKIINLLFKGLAYNTREHFAHFKSRLSLIVLVNVVLNRTVVVNSDRRFLHLQSQSELYHVSCTDVIPSTDVIQLTLTLKMATAQVVETSVTVNNNSPTRDYVHPDDQTQPTLKWLLGSNLSQFRSLLTSFSQTESGCSVNTLTKK